MSAYKRGRYLLVLKHRGKEKTKEIFSEDGSDVDEKSHEFALENPEWQTGNPEDNSGNDVRWIGPE